MVQPERLIEMENMKNTSRNKPAADQREQHTAGEIAVQIIQAWKADPQLRAEFGGDILRYKAYIESLTDGRIKVCSGLGLIWARASSILRVDDVCTRTGLSRSSIDRLEARGEFPPRLQLSASDSGAIGWLDADIDRWINTRPPKFLGGKK